MEEAPEWYGKRVLVLGCGNILFGDDGFGPSVVEFLKENFEIPDDVYVEDVGTSVRHILFTVLLGKKKPERIVIIDSMDVGRVPGEVFETEADCLPEKKRDDFSMHQMPTSNLLRELSDLAGVDVVLISCQVERIPDEVSTGLQDLSRRQFQGRQRRSSEPSAGKAIRLNTSAELTVAYARESPLLRWSKIHVGRPRIRV
ncbi:MAG: hydrogenase maturation protease [Thermoplasmata archaeon]